MKINKFLNNLKKSKTAYIFILPSLALFVVFFLLPLINTFRYSLLEWSNSILPTGFKGLGNYINIFTKDTVFRIATINNFKLLIIVMIVQLSLPIFLALLLDKKMKGRAFFRLIFFAPVLVSWVMIATIWRFIFIPNIGLVQNLLNYLHLGSFYHSWLGDPRYALYIMALVIIWQCTGFNMVIYLANLQSIPEDVIEAATIDGASEWTMISKIKIPLLRSSMSLVAVFTVINVFKIYEGVAFLTGGGPGQSTQVLAFYMVRRIGTGFQYAYACALSTVITVMILILTIIVNQVIFNKRFEVEY
jgi:raffinose/stachyose/melibiose transport system permease protein